MRKDFWTIITFFWVVLTPMLGKTEYATKSMRALDALLKLQTESGLYPTLIHNLKSSLSFANNDISIGAMGDSFYEYLLKIWLQVTVFSWTSLFHLHMVLTHCNDHVHIYNAREGRKKYFIAPCMTKQSKALCTNLYVDEMDWLTLRVRQTLELSFEPNYLLSLLYS